MIKEAIRKRIGERLRELRIKSGHPSYDGFAFTNELDKNTVLRIEQGKNFNIDSLIDILNVHKISLQDFFKEL